MSRWVALFSQTGSEIAELSTELNHWPNRIYTNNADLNKINTTLHDKIAIMSHTGIEEALRYESEMPGLVIVTLHGYLRILSPAVCNLGLHIYNGHPGLINMYPELKGKDPQERVLGKDYEYIGSVVHKVTTGVDEGRVVSSAAVKNVATSTEEVYNSLRYTSKTVWLQFLRSTL